MKRYLFILSFFIALLFGVNIVVYSQCTTNLYASPYPAGTFSPTCNGGTQNITTSGFASEYSNVNVVAGTTYCFTSNVSSDFITISDGTPTALMWGQSPVVWTATITGTIRFYTHTNSLCGSQAASRTRSVSCCAGGPPANDNCTSPVALTSGVPMAGTNMCANWSSTDPIPWCRHTISTRSSVWYTFTTPASMGTLVVNVARIGITWAAVSIFTGSCGAFTEIGCNDPYISAGNPSLTISCLNPSTTYYIMVWTGNAGATPGTFNITATFTAGGGAVANDCCSNATALASGVPLGGTLANATVAPSDPLPMCRNYFWVTGYYSAAINNATVWYTYTTPASVGQLNVAVTSALTRVGISVFTGSCANLTETGCVSPLTGNASILLTCLQPSTTYYIMIWSDEGTIGAFNITATYTAGGLPAANDNFANATALTVGAAAIAGTTSCSSIEPGENLACGLSPTQSVWYKFTATAAITYISLLYTGGTCYESSAVWSTPALPASNNFCGLESCQSAGYGQGQVSNVGNTIYQLNTVIGIEYHISVMYNGAGCAVASAFTIQATNTAPAGNISNVSTQLPSAPYVGCYLNNPLTNPALACTTPGCTVYPMVSGAGNSSNLVSDAYYSFTTGPFMSNDITFQNCILSTCGAGNTLWLIWQLYDATGTICIASGNLSDPLTLANVGCNMPYILHYMWEPINCDYTSQTPFISNFGSTSCALPVELISFSTECKDNKVVVDWITLSELNNDFFTLERSKDGTDFESLATIEGAGNSNSMKFYSYSDDNPLPGTSYYRLKQTDYDGTVNVSEITSVSCNGSLTPEISYYPNPFTDELITELVNFECNEAVLTLFDMLGNKVLEKKIKNITTTNNKFNIDLSHIASGVYFANFKSNDFVKVTKITKR